MSLRTNALRLLPLAATLITLHAAAQAKNDFFPADLSADFADGLLIYPAGSLSGTFTEMVKVFPAPPGLWRRRSDTAQRCNRASSVPQHLDRSGFYQRQDWLPG